MRLRKKLVKTAVAFGLLGGMFQAASCNVSPELLSALVSVVQSQVQQGGEFSFSSHFNGPNGVEHEGQWSYGADGPAASDDEHDDSK